MLYPNLARTMSTESVTRTDIATVLNISPCTVTAKMEGQTISERTKYQIGFTLVEAMTIKKVFFKKYDFQWLFDFSLAEKTAQENPA